MAAFTTTTALPRTARRSQSHKRVRIGYRFTVPVAKLSAVLFDCDGVLAESERDGHRAAFNAAFEAFGLPDRWSAERYGVLLEVGGGKERMTAHWNESNTWPASHSNADERDELVRALHKKKTELFNQMVADGRVPLRDGVRDVIAAALSTGVKVAVCSTSQEPAVRGVVAQLGSELADQIPIFAGDVVPRKKPAPDVYLLALDKLRLNPTETCVVEDSGIGVASAKAAGLPVLVTKSAYTQDEDFSKADLVVSSIAEEGISLSSLEQIVDGGTQ